MGEHEIAKAMLDNVAEMAMLVAQSSRESALVPPVKPVLVDNPASTS